MTGPATDTADVIIIGTGVIGTATAFELAKQGYKPGVLIATARSVMALLRGHVRLSGCIIPPGTGPPLLLKAIITGATGRTILACLLITLWPVLLNVAVLVMKTEANGYLEKHIGHSQALSIPIEDWDADQIQARLPIYDLASYAPAKPRDDDAFGQPNGTRIKGGIFWPKAGYVTDPALSAQNLAAAAALHGARFPPARRGYRNLATKRRGQICLPLG